MILSPHHIKRLIDGGNVTLHRRGQLHVSRAYYVHAAGVSGPLLRAEVTACDQHEQHMWGALSLPYWEVTLAPVDEPPLPGIQSAAQAWLERHRSAVRA